jgi:hypothetical protein
VKIAEKVVWYAFHYGKKIIILHQHIRSQCGSKMRFTFGSQQCDLYLIPKFRCLRCRIESSIVITLLLHHYYYDCYYIIIITSLLLFNCYYIIIITYCFFHNSLRFIMIYDRSLKISNDNYLFLIF